MERAKCNKASAAAAVAEFQAGKMEEQIEKFGSGRKQKRLNNKRQRGQVKNYLKKVRPEDFVDDIDDDYYEEEEWQIAS